jgi:alkyldihydroxyacetonephosphate synthase
LDRLVASDKPGAAPARPLVAAGGTITHHRAVRRDRMPWRCAQRPALFGRALATAKSALDPPVIMNPGML